MFKAYVLIVAEPGKTKQVCQTLLTVQDATEVSEVLGPYDIVVKLQVAEVQDIPRILSTQIREIAGIQSTTSLVSFSA